MVADNRSYYSDLGVSPTASAAEIKAVYRALSKIYHPDVNKDKAATEKFRRVTEAYEVLTDASRRAKYDRTVSDSASVETEPTNKSPRNIETPIVTCSVCKVSTAQPRFLVFRQVVSFLLLTSVKPTAGVYCSACASKQALRSTLVTAAFGWWGLPWGPIYTLMYGIKNAFGGERDSELEEQLLWQNTVAFVERGNFDLAASISNKLKTAKDPKISVATRKLHAALEAEGKTIKPLKSSWKIGGTATLVQLASLSVVPLLAYYAIAEPFGPSRLANSSNYRAPLTPQRASQNESVAPSESSSRVVDLCPFRPRNGQLLKQQQKLAEHGHRLTVKNGSGGDAIVKVREPITKRTIVSFFVEKNRTASINGIPDGNYSFQFATGLEMTLNCLNFIEPSASAFDKVETFRTEYTSTQIISQELSLTLYAVANGNARTKHVEDAEFQKD
jgi:hypothetical protein